MGDQKRSDSTTIDLEDMEAQFEDGSDLAAAINDALMDAENAIKQKAEEPDFPDESEMSNEEDSLEIDEEEIEEQPQGLALVDGEDTPREEEHASKEQEYYDRLLRTMAEFENYKKRVVKEQEEFRRFAIEDLVMGILPIMDNFERAIQHVQESTEAGALLDGITMIHRQMKDLLKHHGVRSIESVGKPFDPAKHQAVQMQETGDHAPNTVIQEFQRGYFLRERLIRPAMVVVATTPKTETSAPADEEEIEELLDPIDETEENDQENTTA